MMSLVLGALTVWLSAYGLAHWFSDSSLLIKLLFPISFLCGGALAVLAGMMSLKK